jgi:hypothetical protein
MLMKQTRFYLFYLIALYCLLAIPTWSIEILHQSWFPTAPKYPSPYSNKIAISTVDEFLDALSNVTPGTEITLEDGLYYLPHYVEISTDHVMISSQSGNREHVILDGSQSQHGELVGFRSCKNVTVSSLTIQNVKWNGFKINADDNVQDLTIHNCVIHNIWERGIKSVRVPKENREVIRPKNIIIQYCLFYNDRPKRFSDDDKDTTDSFNGNYIGGIDAMHAKRWEISDNVFFNIQGRTREGRGCVFLWHHAEDCVVERNIIIDCDVGIALGNSSGIGPNQSSVHGTNMIVRNNFITCTPESGIVTAYTKDCQIVNNTIYDPQNRMNRMNRMIRIVHDNAGLLVANNILSGPGMSVETENEIHFKQNLIGDYEPYFINPKSGNLHLNMQAFDSINKGYSIQSVLNDIDGDVRDEPIDIGADEWKPEGKE